MRNLDIRVIYLLHNERAARGRDVVTRPATPLDDPKEIDTWVADVESHPTATIYRLERYPHVTIYYWHRHGTYTVKWIDTGISATTDTNNWDAAMQAAYNYGAWDFETESE